ncbi:sulfatase [Aquimarina sp. 2201CG1-2-11]|uniref:sulfatase family protein n=1 Tax=Aquimarina discodermiae TaxID=3231043 RepID=UPI0034619BF9
MNSNSNCLLRFISILLLMLSIGSCAEKKSEEKKSSDSLAEKKEEVKKTSPNILWIYVEDISPDLGAYGDPLANTPQLDAMAKQGVRFTNTIMPSPVCSPSRSAMITGVMSTTIGTHNHHSSRTEASAIRLPDTITTIPELFKKAGYYTFNSGKDDYNFWYNRKDLYNEAYYQHPLYGKSAKRNYWKEGIKNKPFFGQIQLSGSKHIFSKTFKEKVITPIDRSKVTIPPYYPDVPLIREEWAQYLETLELTDMEVKKILDQLKADGLLENTVVFFFSDHGMRSLRHKQFLYEGGIKVPFIVQWEGNPDLIKPGTVNDKLISGLDIGATSLALAGIKKPDYMEGENLFAADHKARPYVISTRDRCDFTIDRIRSVRTERFKYIKNFYPNRSYMQPNYRDEWESTQLLRKLYAEGKLNELQSRIFKDNRPEEELYDLVLDPNEINNLATNVEYQNELKRHREILNNWIKKTGDKGQYPEDKENLKYMLGIWDEQAVNEEYTAIRKEFPDLAGSLKDKKSAKFELVE